MRVNKNRLAILFLAFLLFMGSLYLYIDKIFLPIQLKQYVIDKAASSLGREIFFKRIDYYPLKGIVVQDLVIFNKENKQLPFLHVKEAQFNLLLPALLRKKTIVIPSLILKEPELNLLREGPRTWNFSDLLAQEASGTAAPNVFIKSLKIQDATVAITDKTGQTGPTLISNMQANIDVSLLKRLHFTLQALIPREGTELQAQGTWQFANQGLDLQIKSTQLDLDRFLALFDIDPGFKTEQAKIAVMDVQIKHRKDNWKISGKLFAELALSSQDKTGRGQWMLNDFQIRKDGRDFFLRLGQGSFVKNAAVHLPNVLFFSGDARTPGLQFNQTQTVTTAEGGLELINSLIQQTDKSFKGHFLADRFEFKSQPKRWDLQMITSSKDSDLTWGPLAHIKGAFPSASIKIKSQGAKTTADSKFSLKQADITFADNKKIKGDLAVKELAITHDRKRLSILAEVDSSNLDFLINEKQSLIGQPSLRGGIIFDLTARNIISYDGDLTFSSATLAGVKDLGTISGASGQIFFSKDTLKTDSLRINCLDTNLELKGTLKNFPSPMIDATISAEDLDIARWGVQFFDSYLKEHQLAPSGTTDIQLTYRGLLKNPSQADIRARLELKNGLLKTALLPAPLSEIKGQILYASNLLEWRNLSLKYAETDYTLNGSLTDFFRPIVSTQILFNGFDLRPRLKFLNNAFSVTSFQGNFRNSQLTLAGDFTHRGPERIESNMKGQFTIQMEDLAFLPYPFLEPLKAAALEGALKGSYSFQGNIKDWPSGKTLIKATSPRVSGWGNKSENISLNLTNNSPQAGQLELSATSYGGLINIASAFDLKQTDYPFEAILNLSSLDLDVIKKENNWKNQNLSGKLSIDSRLTGSIKDINQLSGNGTFKISDGNIWNFKLLDGIWGALLIPEFTNIVFTGADASFFIQNKQITTKDLKLTSRVADLKGEGWFDFDRKVNLLIIPHFRETELLQSKSLKKGFSSIMTQTRGYINIRIHGTLEHPQYTVQTFPTKIIEKATDAILDGFRGLFEEIIR